MSVDSPLRTHALAKAAGLSVQQVRHYEAEGLIPPVERSPGGYRCFTRRHLDALLAARKLVDSHGIGPARRIMQAVHAGRQGEALALIDERHAQLTQSRAQLEQTRQALSVLAAQLPSTDPHQTERLTVGEAAERVGVRVSALRFWERQGLLHPMRDRANRYRLYDERQMRRLRAVVLLRQADHDFDAIRSTLAALEVGQPQRTLAAVDRRSRSLETMSWRCLEASAALYAYLTTHGAAINA